MLMKRGRDNGQFLSRRFVLSEREGTLKYFTKYDVSLSALLGLTGPYWDSSTPSLQTYTHVTIHQHLHVSVLTQA